MHKGTRPTPEYLAFMRDLKAKVDAGEIDPATLDLDTNRAFIALGIIQGELNFEDGTISRVLLDFFNWLHTNTDTFDPVMVSILLDEWHGASHAVQREANPLGFSDEQQRDIIKDFLERPLTEKATPRLNDLKSAGKAADIGG